MNTELSSVLTLCVFDGIYLFISLLYTVVSKDVVRVTSLYLSSVFFIDQAQRRLTEINCLRGMWVEACSDAVNLHLIDAPCQGLTVVTQEQ